MKIIDKEKIRFVWQICPLFFLFGGNIIKPPTKIVHSERFCKNPNYEAKLYKPHKRLKTSP